MAVGLGILYDFPILYFVLLAMSTLALSTFVYLSKNQILPWRSIPCEALN